MNNESYFLLYKNGCVSTMLVLYIVLYTFVPLSLQDE